MKAYRLLPVLFFLAISLQAQTFEGTIRWTMNMEITDPQMKAEMERAQQELNDPEKQAEIKEMQERLNSPEMKKMMESNPQMKAAMDAAMKSAANGGAPGGMSTMMPTGMTLKIKGENMISIMEGGIGGGMEMLQAKGKPATRVNRVDKTFSPMPESKGDPATNKVKVTKTAETKKILGYDCAQYVAELTENGTTMKQLFWTTTDIKDMDMKGLARQRMGQGGQSMFYDQIVGVPLKMEFSTPQGNMIMEAIEIKREKLNDSDFTIPADFKEVKMPGGN